MISQYNRTILYSCFHIKRATELFYSVLNSFLVNAILKVFLKS